MIAPKRAPCWNCGGRGRGGPRNQPCYCQEPKAPRVHPRDEKYGCPACAAVWLKSLGTHICPSCGYDRDAGARHRFSGAHHEIRAIVQGGGSMPPESASPVASTADGWMDGFI
jgi:hypothetical protein